MGRGTVPSEAWLLKNYVGTQHGAETDHKF